MECCKLKREKEKEEKAAKEKMTISPSDTAASTNTASVAIARVSPSNDIIHLFQATAIEEPYAGTECTSVTRTTLEDDDLHNSWLVDLGASRMLRTDFGMSLSALWCLNCLLYGYGIMRMQVAIPGTL